MLAHTRYSYRSRYVMNCQGQFGLDCSYPYSQGNYEHNSVGITLLRQKSLVQIPQPIERIRKVLPSACGYFNYFKSFLFYNPGIFTEYGIHYKSK